MSPDLVAPVNVHPTRQELLAEFGEEYLTIQSFFRFCFVPGGRLNLLKELTLEEGWGSNDFVLLKYLAVHLRLAIEQGRYVWNDDQIVLTAGRLVTPTGAPIYVGLVRNNTSDENPWVLNWVGERPSCTDLPEPADLGDWVDFEPGAEVIIAFDLGQEDRRLKIRGLADAPVVTQVAAISGAIQWALHRALEVRQIHGGGRGYFVPLYLTSREDVSCAPDYVAPLIVQDERVVVRTLLDPHVAYSPARTVVERWEQLPPWLLDVWEVATTDASDSDEEED